jgi:hypothetical protein
MIYCLVSGAVACTVQHEVFGHGYRLRELAVTPKKYKIMWSGEGATYFKMKRNFPLGALQAANVAGLKVDLKQKLPG